MSRRKCGCRTKKGSLCQKSPKKGNKRCHLHDSCEDRDSSSDFYTDIGSLDFTKKGEVDQLLHKLGSSCELDINGWEPEEILGTGTVGTVWMICRKNEECAAVKLQKFDSVEAKIRWQSELTLQKRFHPFSPRVRSYCGTRSFGAIVMEQMGDTLDGRLAKMSMKDLEKLEKLGGQIMSICEFLVESGMCHGDLALFNFAFDKNDNLKMIDFDRAYAVSGRNKIPQTLLHRVDFYRIQLEMYRHTQSTGTKEINPKLLQYFRKNWLQKWATPFGLEVAADGHDAEHRWMEAYEEYCKAANILCLGES